MSTRRPPSFPEPRATATVRCAVYTRKSTDEGLDREFSSLDAQREAGEAYIVSQKHAGWVCLPTRYDDGGFSGGNTERPALQRLLADVAAGRVDAIVTYKVDRLSRSLLDFTRLMELFDAHGVSFVSVTQQLNTASSMGRLVLNVLLSFAQFEREIIAERTKDKLSAMRKKGMWVGGLPPLGYDVDAATRKLMVNADEAEQVRAIFRLYREHGSLLPVVDALRDRGWVNKQSTTKKGTLRGGKPFDRTSLHRLLTNVAYVGQVRYDSAVYAAEHAPIVEAALFAEVQAQLARNAQTGGAVVRNRSGAILKGLLRCAACDAAMTPTHTGKADGKRYRYYQCVRASKRGHQQCPTRLVPAGAIEDFVVERLRAIGRDAALIRETARAARQHAHDRRTELAVDRRRLERDARAAEGERRSLPAQLASDPSGASLARLAELQARLADANQRLVQIQSEEESLARDAVTEAEVAAALGHFDLVWTSLTPTEQARLTALLVERVAYDARDGTLDIHFHDAGLATLAAQAEGALS